MKILGTHIEPLADGQSIVEIELADGDEGDESPHYLMYRCTLPTKGRITILSLQKDAIDHAIARLQEESGKLQAEKQSTY